MTNILYKLNNLIASRDGTNPETSWTDKLLSQGVERCAKKFGEEAVELIIAAASENKNDIEKETADVIYHLLVLLRATDVSFDDVLKILEDREKESGISEKLSRQK